MGKDEFQVNLLKEVTFSERINASELQGCVFRRDGESLDPAGLCDGGDYIQHIQIRILDDKGDIHLSMYHMERSEWWSGTLSWEEFFNLLMQGILKSDKIKHHAH